MKFRMARHTNDLEKIKSFYVTILGFEVLGGFENHNKYDGVFIGKPNLDWHLEFTKSDEIAVFNFDKEEYLVLYPENNSEYTSILEKISKNKIKFIESKNPFWKDNGKIILDPDGYQIIISNLKTL